MLRVSSAVVVLGLAAVLSMANGAERGVRKNSDEEAVRQAGASLVDAINRGDAGAAADHWTLDGDLVNPSGQLIKGREAIHRELEAIMAEGRGKLETHMLQVRFVAPDVALVDGTSQRIPEPPGPYGEDRHSIVCVKRDGKWLIAALRAAVFFPPSNYDRLKAFEWRVGHWRYESTEGERKQVDSVVRWTDQKNFLEHHFSVRVNGQVIGKGLERVGWDPREKKIKSWLFGSDGSVLEGFWSQDGEHWVVTLSGTLGDGSEVSATDILTPLDADRLRFQSTKRVRAGIAEPDRQPLELRRVARP